MIVLPSPTVNSFFSASIERIVTCLEDLKRIAAPRNLAYVVPVGGFSSSPLVLSITKAKFHGGSCAVITPLRPDVVIVCKAVLLFVNNAAVFYTRKARLTYGVGTTTLYNKRDQAHVQHYHQHKCGPGDDGKPRIDIFSRHVVVGDDIPEDGGCQPKRYSPLRSDASSITIPIFASHIKDIMFPNDECFKLGEVNGRLDMSVPFADREVLVQFNFGGTELSVTAQEKTTGKTSQVTLSLGQEAVHLA